MDVDVSKLPFGPKPLVHLCVNDEHGLRTGRLFAVRVNDASGDTVISLMTDDLDVGVGIIFDMAAHNFEAGGQRYRFGAHHSYTGNILWDAVRMSESGARRLVARLIECGWHVDEVVDGDTCGEVDP